MTASSLPAASWWVMASPPNTFTPWYVCWKRVCTAPRSSANALLRTNSALPLVNLPLCAACSDRACSAAPTASVPTSSGATVRGCASGPQADSTPTAARPNTTRREWGNFAAKRAISNVSAGIPGALGEPSGKGELRYSRRPGRGPVGANSYLPSFTYLSKLSC